MKKMMMVLAILFVVVGSGFSSNFVWPNGHHKGGGIKVVGVYPQWDNHWICFEADNGKTYFYNWGADSEEPTTRAKMIMSMLLTAYSTDTPVTVHYNTVPQMTTWHEFTFINMHKN